MYKHIKHIKNKLENVAVKCLVLRNCTVGWSAFLAAPSIDLYFIHVHI